MRDALRVLGHQVIVVTPDHIELTDGSVAALPQLGRFARRLQECREFLHGGDGSHPFVRLRIINGFRAARSAGAQIFEIEESFGWARRLAGHGIPVVQRLHGPHVLLRDEFESRAQKNESDLRQKAEIAGMRSVDAITSPTQRLLDELTKLYSLKPPIARAIPNPIRTAPESARWTAQSASSDQILFVGRFDRLKGADIAIRAFAKAIEGRPSLTMVMAGPDFGLTGPDRARIHFDEFIAREIRPEVRSQIRYVGRQSPADIAELRLRSAFVIVASRFENFPYSIAEAMAVGMPVLSSNTFGGTEMIRDGLDGSIVPIGDTEAMADAMVRMANNPSRLSEMGASAYARAAEWLSPERIAREMVSVYRQAIARH
jgi:glycosyltransferase involved in cell wall biosynthesis